MRLAYDLYSPSGDVQQNLPPVIIMHGMLDSRKTWKNIAPRIANLTGRMVYAIDARNHGESPWDNNFTFDLNADDIDEFLDQHEIPKASLVGHSMGGRTAMALALKKPEKIEKIVVEDINMRTWLPSHTGLLVQIVNILRDSVSVIPPGADESTAKQTLVEHLATLLRPEKDPKKIRYDLSIMPLKRDGSSYSWEANLDAIQELLSTDKIKQTFSGVFTGDALFIYGCKSIFKVDKDPLIPKHFPHATRLGIDRATHLLHYECPDRFIQEVSSFLNGAHTLKAKY